MNIEDLSILILDDDEEWLAKHSYRLQKAGYNKQIHVLYEHEALMKVQDDTELNIKAAILDEILLDPENPLIKQDRQGSDVAKEIRNKRKDILLIMVSSAPEAGSAKEGLRTKHALEKVSNKVFAKFLLDENYGDLINYLNDNITQNSFIKEGDYWSITFAGENTKLKDEDGLKYIFHLIANPGKEFHATQLIQIKGTIIQSKSLYSGMNQEQIEDYGLVISGLGDAGQLSDEQAKKQYKNRLLELDEEITKAEQADKQEEAEKLEEEKQFIIKELQAAFYKGRPRSTTGPDEKARQVISKAIHRSLAHIAKKNKKLAAHLNNSLKIGYKTYYNPKHHINWLIL